MNAEFNWWLLIVGLVVGAGLVWLVVADSRRREVDVTELERPAEAHWIAGAMADAGRRIDDRDVIDILRLHEAYLEAPPPDAIFDDGVDEPGPWIDVPSSRSPGGGDLADQAAGSEPLDADRPRVETR